MSKQWQQLCRIMQANRMRTRVQREAKTLGGNAFMYNEQLGRSFKLWEVVIPVNRPERLFRPFSEGGGSVAG